MKYLVCSIFALTAFISSCGGGGSDNNTVPASTNQSAIEELGQPPNTLSADTEETESYAVGGPGSEKKCYSALGAARSSLSRRIAACKLAELAYLDASTVSFNADYRNKGIDYLPSKPSLVHTGIDLQGHPKPSRSRIGAMLPGKVIGINSQYGQVVTKVTLSNGLDIQIGYMHMVNIAVALGQTVSKGTVLGVEGGKGPGGSTDFVAHLHIEMRSADMDPNVVLSTTASSSRWIYALDPLVYAEEIYAKANGDTNPEQTGAPTTPSSLYPASASSPGPTLSQVTALSWELAGTQATYFDVGLRDLSTGNLILNTTTTSKFLAFPALRSGSAYRWNIRACNASGCSQFSPLQYFQIGSTTVNSCTGNTGSGFSIGQSEALSCPAGQTGSQSRVCQAGGIWSAISGACAGTPNTCTSTTGLTYTQGQTEALNCSIGQTGSQSRVCQAGGAWGSISGSCTSQLASCSGLTGSNYLVGQTEALSCQSGQTGSQSRTCEAGGTWGNVLGVCSTQPASCTGLTGASYSLGQAENLSCQAGLTGSQSRLCQAGGTWGNVTGLCVSPQVILNSASKTGNLGKYYACSSGANTCVQAGITLNGQNMNGFTSVAVKWSGLRGNGSTIISSASGQITSTSDTSIVVWPTVFDSSDPVGTCYTWTFSISKAGFTSSDKSLSTGQICRP